MGGLRAGRLRARGLTAGGARAVRLRLGGLRAGGLSAEGLSAGGLRAGGLKAVGLRVGGQRAKNRFSEVWAFHDLWALNKKSAPAVSERSVRSSPLILDQFYTVLDNSRLTNMFITNIRLKILHSYPIK